VWADTVGHNHRDKADRIRSTTVPDAPYRRVHVIINPASGGDEPVLNVLNDTFRRYEVDWAVSVTHKYGDAATQARQAIDDGVDLVAGYGGDGTQHEIANAVMEAAVATGRTTPMGILPGGTGNGFAREMGVPGSLREATEVLCTSRTVRAVDVARLSDLGQAKTTDRYFVQRMYVGVEPEEQTSRELKDRYGVFAYVVNAAQHARDSTAIHYRTELDGTSIEFDAERVYVVNSGMMGTGLRITQTYAIDDGLLDCFLIDRHAYATMAAAALRMLDPPIVKATRYHRQCRTIRIETEPDQPGWADGEYIGRTPVTVDVVPGALAIVVP
jgi:diacylglycerol kinase (ATP)